MASGPQPTEQPRVVVITDDVLGDRMAGPAIRAVEIARALSARQPVALVSAANGHVDVAGVDCGRPSDLRRLVEWSDVVVLQGAVMVRHPWLHSINTPIVVDLYDPFHLEALQLSSDDPLHSVDIVESTIRTLSDQIVRGDFFICATERQRDLWLGHMGAVGRINHLTRSSDPDFRSLIDLVPFGLPDTPPASADHTFHDIIPAIGTDDLVAFWAGGIYDWFDPITLIDAVASIDTTPPLHLVFLGGRHPNPDVPEMAAATRSRQHAADLGIEGGRVHFIDEWIPYEQRQRLLVAAHIGVTTHHRSAETAFSFRTRMLDYLWAGLPVVCTEGDELSATVEAAGAGKAVPADDTDALASALMALAGDTDALDRAARASALLARQYRWTDIVEPLRAFTLDPETAADRRQPVARTAVGFHRPPRQSGPSHMWRRTRLNLAAGGFRQLSASILRKLSRRADGG